MIKIYDEIIKKKKTIFFKNTKILNQCFSEVNFFFLQNPFKSNEKLTMKLPLMFHLPVPR